MTHTILFTGHMIDKPGRAEPRFPPGKEQGAREAIAAFLDEEKKKYTSLEAIAGGACGGDIIFHELCMQKNIPGQLFLALPPGQFKKRSVDFAGEDWPARFDRLVEILPVRILERKDHSRDIWAEANAWMLEAALARGGKNMTLLALWNGEKGDAEGGTEHLIRIAKEREASVSVIDLNKIK